MKNTEKNLLIIDKNFSHIYIYILEVRCSLDRDNIDYEGGLFSMLKNTILLGKICTAIIVMAFVVVPLAYASQNAVNINKLFYRDIAAAATPESQPYITINGHPAENLIWFEANAVRTMFLETLHKYKNYRIDSLFGARATTKNILNELNQGPKYFHFATHGESGPALKAYNDYLRPKEIYHEVPRNKLKGSPLVFLSACYSLQNYQDKDADSNFGYVFVWWTGVSFVIGSKDVIESAALYWFVLDFYNELLSSVIHNSGIGVAQAFSDAKEKVENDMRTYIAFGVGIALSAFVALFSGGIVSVYLAKVLFSFFVGTVGGYLLTSYLTEALTHLSNLIIYDSSSIASGGGGGGDPPIWIM